MANAISHQPSALSLIPAQYQPPLPRERLILPRDAPGAGDRMELDVLIVGAGPAGLAAAIELAGLSRRSGAELGIGVLEKAEALGEHSLSGAVVHPCAFRELFPRLKDSDFPFHGPVRKEAVYLLTANGQWRLPVPPTMRNHGHYVASLCEIVRWLGHKAEELGVTVFTGFPAAGLLVDGERVGGVRTAATGLDRDGTPLGSYQAPNDIVAKVTALAEGTRGMLAQAWLEWRGMPSENPQIFALGVKEIWETQRPLDRVIHTLGWPLPTDAFGGSFLYPLEPKLLALGLVVGLDYRSTALDVHVLLQRLKLHPLLRRYLEGGEALEWGAKTIPEGGFYAGGFKAGLMTLTRGLFPGGRIAMAADAAVERRPGPADPFAPDGKLTLSKVDGVFKSGNTTRDTIPSHLLVGRDVPAEVAEFYAHVCPAGVYELVDGRLRVNAPNCVDCKATDVLGPRWTPREGGSGPKYKRM